MEFRQNRNATDRLEKIYLLYDRVMTSTTPACRKQCADCCTCNVVMTSLEAGYLTTRLAPEQKEQVAALITRQFPVKRYHPQMTTNQFARLCVEGKAVPEEENDPSWGKCPLLDNDLCPVYDVRPFGCRALMSETACRKNGHARVPPWVLTVNSVFQQTIEHLDQTGVSGNLSDMLTGFPAAAGMTPDHRFVRNEPVRALMIPPEHRQRMVPIVKDLTRLST